MVRILDLCGAGTCDDPCILGRVLDSAFVQARVGLNYSACRLHAHTTIPTNIIGSESKVHCGSAVRFGRAFPDFLITAHHACTFLLELEGYRCGDKPKKKRSTLFAFLM